MIRPTIIRIDATGLNRGIELAQQYSKRAPAEGCNFVAKEVAFGAFENTPVTGPARVDSDMMKIVSPKIGKRGGIVKGTQLRSGKLIKVQRKGKTVEVPLAVLIIQARANPDSRYNELTGGRYALPQSPFKGVSPAAGRAAMAVAENVMIKGRRRAANGFIRAGWLKAIKYLKALSPAKYQGRSRLPAGQNVEALGDVIPAQSGKTETFCQIENDVGLDGKNSVSHNRALQQYGAPALQLAMETEGRKQMDYFLRKSGKEDLEVPVNKAWS